MLLPAAENTRKPGLPLFTPPQQPWHGLKTPSGGRFPASVLARWVLEWLCGHPCPGLVLPLGLMGSAGGISISGDQSPQGTPTNTAPVSRRMLGLGPGLEHLPLWPWPLYLRETLCPGHWRALSLALLCAAHTTQLPRVGAAAVLSPNGPSASRPRLSKLLLGPMLPCAPWT